MPALPRISWCADKGFLYFDIERKKYTIPVLHCYREFTQNLGQPLDSIENYIQYYNYKRVQRNLGILTPIEKHTLYLAA